MTDPMPTGQVRPMSVSLEDEVVALRRELDAVRTRPLTNAGEFTAADPNGNQVFRTGPYYGGSQMPDGTPQWMTWIKDMNGQSRLLVWDPNPNTDGFVQAIYLYDHNGHAVFTTDNSGGMAEPHLPIVLYPKIAPPTATIGAPFGWHFLAAASAGSEQVCWSGHIGYVSHPKIWVRGLWGGTNTAEYKLKVNGITIGTWTTPNGPVGEFTVGPFNLLTAANLGSWEVVTEITARRTGGAGDIACQVIHCHQRQT
jgi:hypothetical protein